MTQTPPPYPSYPNAPQTMAYAVPTPDADNEHLRLLAIFHFILGPIQLLFALFPLIYVVVGILFLAGIIPEDGSRGQQGPPTAVGWFLIVLGVVMSLIAAAFGALTLYSGFKIRARQYRMFSIVIAGLNCIHFPFGTALGVFTLIVLLRRSVEALYRSQDRLAVTR